MPDGGDKPWPSRLHDGMKIDCYLFRLVPQNQLASFWRMLFELNPTADTWNQLLDAAFR